MTRDTVSLTLPDVSHFAKTLRIGLGEDAPGHQTLLNIIAKAGGYRNFQHLKATQTPDDPQAPAEGRAISRALDCFDMHGRLARWSTKRKTRIYGLWALWAQLPVDETWSERQISALFDTMCTLNDAAQIRRSLVEEGLLTRDRDGSNYRKRPATPDATARDVIRAVKARKMAAGAKTSAM